MKLNFQTYKDKVAACFIGKNIGGTMGTPYEGQRTYNDIQGFVTKPGEVLPNDDLDLQLVWLHAVEQIGPYNLTAQKLGEFWLSFITPYWNEYGICKTNMRHGLIPPLSGDYENSWNNSNGAWIRTEIWASLCPGCPDAAAKYAIEDAKVDHGAGEGTIAAGFVAAMQSAAFVVKDLRKCIEIALSSIPEDSRMAQSVRLLLDTYDKGGKTPFEAREIIRLANADIGDGWFEAPSNVTYSLLGMLWGNCDFKKSMIIAINCGDDTDCTGATVGSTLGILGGTKAIPEDWRSHIGDDIVTVSIACGVLYTVPKTCTELTDRVAKMAPVVLIANHSDLTFTDGKDEIPDDIVEQFLASRTTYDALCHLEPFSFPVDAGFMSATVSYPEGVDIKPGETKKIRITYRNSKKIVEHPDINAYIYGDIPYSLNLRFLLPEGFTMTGKSAVRLPHMNPHDFGVAVEDYVVTAPEKIEAINRLVVEVVAEDRVTPLYLPVILLG